MSKDAKRFLESCGRRNMGVVPFERRRFYGVRNAIQGSSGKVRAILIAGAAATVSFGLLVGFYAIKAAIWIVQEVSR